MPVPSPIPVYLEIGAKRVFAGALEWPGWSRSERDEDGALEALLAYGPRYRRALGSAARGLVLPESASTFDVRERLDGNANTDFGVPGIAPAADSRPVHTAELERELGILGACWRAFDRAARAARGSVLATGPAGRRPGARRDRAPCAGRGLPEHARGAICARRWDHASGCAALA
jgi:hypothetical protein